MTFTQFLRLLKNNGWFLLGVSLLSGLIAFLVTHDESMRYNSQVTVYTGLLSGYDLQRDEGTVTIHQVNSRVDNMIGIIEARETAEQTAMRLLANYLVFPDSVRAPLMSSTRRRLANHLPVAAQQSLLAPSPQSPTLDATLRRIRSMARSLRSEALHALIYEEDASPFSLEGIRADLNASRIQTSDLIRIEYGSPDPFLSKHTLDIALDVFADKYESLRRGRVNSVGSRLEKETDLVVIDPPYIPEDDTRGNQILVVGGATAGSFFLFLGLLFLASVLDSTLRTPNRAEEATGLPMATAYPLVDEVNRSPVPRGRLLSTLDNQMLRTVQLSIVRSADSAPFISSKFSRASTDAESSGRGALSTNIPAKRVPPSLILITSTQWAEGKTFVAKRLSHAVRSRNASTLFLAPHDLEAVPEGVKEANYPGDASPKLYNDIVDLISMPAAAELDTIIMELPPLTSCALPIPLAQRANAVFVVIRADRSWSRTDAEALDALRLSTDAEPALVLNGVDLEHIEDLVGPVPDERRNLRGWLNRASRLEFRRPLPFTSRSKRYSS